MCSFSDFQCGNGPCISSSLRCDSDFNCLDGSDEEGCTCLSTELPCPSGECVPADKICNGEKDCPDGSDEEKCGKLLSHSFCFVSFFYMCRVVLLYVMLR